MKLMTNDISVGYKVVAIEQVYDDREKDKKDNRSKTDPFPEPKSPAVLTVNFIND